MDRLEALIRLASRPATPTPEAALAALRAWGLAVKISAPGALRARAYRLKGQKGLNKTV